MISSHVRYDHFDTSPNILNLKTENQKRIALDKSLKKRENKQGLTFVA